MRQVTQTPLGEKVYEGEIVDGKSHGKGKETLSGSTYEGDFVNGVRNGKGKLTIQGLSVYEGDFVNGKPQGKGKRTLLEDGTVYEGDFVDDKWHGKGKLTYTNGCVYEGDFIDGKFQGKGKFTWADGRVYEGDWAGGKRTGKGKMKNADGSVYEGNFIDGVSEEQLKKEKTKKNRKKFLDELLGILPFVLILGGMVSYIVLLVFFRNTHSNPHLNWEKRIPSDLLQKNLFAVAGLIVIVTTGIIINAVRIKKGIKNPNDSYEKKEISLAIFYTVFGFLIPTGILVAIGLWSTMLGFGVGFLSIGVLLIGAAFEHWEGREVKHGFGWPLGILGVILTIFAIVEIID